MTTKPVKTAAPLAATIAPLTNVSLFNELVERITTRHRNLPAIGAWYGASGLGKTTAATYGAHRFRAYYVEIGSSWTVAKFCQALLIELGLPTGGTIAAMVDRIISALAHTQRPLIVDEFDHVVRRGYVETIREIHDKSGAPIILIGEEQLWHKLQMFERFHNRILDWVPASFCDARDVMAMASIYAPGIEIAADLAELILTQSERRARRIAVNLDRLRETAGLEGWNKVDRAAWGNRSFFTGAAPLRRIA